MNSLDFLGEKKRTLTPHAKLLKSGEYFHIIFVKYQHDWIMYLKNTSCQISRKQIWDSVFSTLKYTEPKWGMIIIFPAF